MKICTKCLLEKPESCFSRQSKNKDGLQYACKECDRFERVRRKKLSAAYQREYLSRPDKKLHRQIYAKEYRSTRKREISENARIYYSDPKNRAVKIIQNTRTRCRNMSIPFEISVDDIPMPEFCPILGVPIDYNMGHGYLSRYSPSIDRIDNDKGYIPGNVQIVSRKANTMKSDATPKELLEFARWEIETYGEDDDKN